MGSGRVIGPEEAESWWDEAVAARKTIPEMRRQIDALTSQLMELQHQQGAATAWREAFFALLGSLPGDELDQHQRRARVMR